MPTANPMTHFTRTIKYIKSSSQLSVATALLNRRDNQFEAASAPQLLLAFMTENWRGQETSQICRCLVKRGRTMSMHIGMHYAQSASRITEHNCCIATADTSYPISRNYAFCTYGIRKQRHIGRGCCFSSQVQMPYASISH